VLPPFPGPHTIVDTAHLTPGATAFGTILATVST
jgi:hypothetical protein